ncbi:MAG: glycyl-radical enzyme activating protein [Clostridia bacterium]|nr:glycyl-radical enzyme activating protein [Clostridia bacterium]
MKGTVFNIQRFSLFDGPGVRSVVFLKGCPLSCIWCHNPEGRSSAPQIMFAADKCIGCGDCADACCRGGHLISEKLHGYLRDKCICCGECAEVCCTEALSVAGKEMDVDSVISEVMRDLPVYRESGGGMTLSGGEPFFQPEFALALLKAAKEQGITTCVETCGQTSESVIREAVKYTDDFYFDYKATGNKLHRELCGVSQNVILRNLELLDELGARVTLRCPIIPDKNESDEHITAIGELAARLSSVVEVHLEPYHRLGVSKAEKLGEAAVFDGEVPARARLEEYCRRIGEMSGKNCKIS